MSTAESCTAGWAQPARLDDASRGADRFTRSCRRSRRGLAARCLALSQIKASRSWPSAPGRPPIPAPPDTACKGGDSLARVTLQRRTRRRAAPAGGGDRRRGRAARSTVCTAGRPPPALDARSAPSPLTLTRLAADVAPGWLSAVAGRDRNEAADRHESRLRARRARRHRDAAAGRAVSGARPAARRSAISRSSARARSAYHRPAAQCAPAADRRGDARARCGCGPSIRPESRSRRSSRCSTAG